MVKKIIVSTLFSSLISFFNLPFGLAQKPSPVRVGDPFPPFSLNNNLSQEELKALRLPPKESITLNDFTSEIILLELLNVHCHTCKEQVPVFNQLWDSLQTNKILKTNAVLFAITVGNNTKEITAFQKSFKPRYPMLADSSKGVFDSLGNLKKGTPQTYLLKKDPSGKWYIVYYHQGPVSSYEIYLRKIEEFFKSDLEGIEPGYKVPQLFFETLEKKYPDESFENKRVLLYFPSLDMFPLDDDIRNTGLQMKVLRSFVNEEKLAILIAGFLNRIFSTEELEGLQKIPTVFLLEDEREALASRFEAGENPLICLVNDSGRIVYRAYSLTSARAEELLKGKTTRLTPNLTKKELLTLMQNTMKVVESTIEKVKTEELVSGETIYLGFTVAEKHEASLVGRIVSKYTICDVCHDVHFYYILDQKGHLVFFNPIDLTKFGNVAWDPQDIWKLKSGVMGKDLFKPLPFDPYVDAVSQATMTSYLIFEGLNDTRKVLKDFSDSGFRKVYWGEICLNNLCQIKKAMALLKKKGQLNNITLKDHTTINTENLQPHLSPQASAKCPTGGSYLLVGEDPICSIHGMKLEP